MPSSCRGKNMPLCRGRSTVRGHSQSRAWCPGNVCSLTSEMLAYELWQPPTQCVLACHLHPWIQPRFEQDKGREARLPGVHHTSWGPDFRNLFQHAAHQIMGPSLQQLEMRPRAVLANITRKVKRSHSLASGPCRGDGCRGPGLCAGTAVKGNLEGPFRWQGNP